MVAHGVVACARDTRYLKMLFNLDDAQTQIYQLEKTDQQTAFNYALSQMH